MASASNTYGNRFIEDGAFVLTNMHHEQLGPSELVHCSDNGIGVPWSEG